MTPHPDVIVIGAGIIGLATAYDLHKLGRNVQILDREEPASQCSSGNAGALSFHSVAPLALPGILANTLKMLGDREGPLYLPPTYLPQASGWLWRFVRSAGEHRVREIATSLAAFFATAQEDHQQLARDIGQETGIRSTGQLHLYRSEEGLAKDAFSWALKSEHGLRTQRINRAEIEALEPNVADPYRIGLLLEDDHSVINPHAYALAIAQKLASNGVHVQRAQVDTLQRDEQGWTVRAGDTTQRARDIVIAAGAWSARLLATLDVHVPLETQRGYHLHVPSSGAQLSRTVVLTDRKVFLTPMDTGLRIAGTVEFGGLERAPDAHRAALLGKHAQEGLRTLDLAGATTWMGHRPCMPDSMPVIGPIRAHRGLWAAFGHGHLGLTGSATTGRLLAQAIATGTPPAALRPFSIERF
jgi:glycine/D-amino acid oxidase-like deaminating enzyme